MINSVKELCCKGKMGRVLWAQDERRYSMFICLHTAGNDLGGRADVTTQERERGQVLWWCLKGRDGYTSRGQTRKESSHSSVTGGTEASYLLMTSIFSSEIGSRDSSSKLERRC